MKVKSLLTTLAIICREKNSRHPSSDALRPQQHKRCCKTGVLIFESRSCGDGKKTARKEDQKRHLTPPMRRALFMDGPNGRFFFFYHHHHHLRDFLITSTTCWCIKKNMAKLRIIGRCMRNTYNFTTARADSSFMWRTALLRRGHGNAGRRSQAGRKGPGGAPTTTERRRRVQKEKSTGSGGFISCKANRALYGEGTIVDHKENPAGVCAHSWLCWGRWRWGNREKHKILLVVASMENHKASLSLFLNVTATKAIRIFFFPCTCNLGAHHRFLVDDPQNNVVESIIFS